MLKLQPSLTSYVDFIPGEPSTGTKLLLHFAGNLADLADLLPALGKACRVLFGTRNGSLYIIRTPLYSSSHACLPDRALTYRSVVSGQ